MQIKIMTVITTPVRIATIRKTQTVNKHNSKRQQGCREMGTLVYC